MNGEHPRSTAKIGDHPIHPMLIPFPIVCFIGTLVTDIVYSRNQDPGWAHRISMASRNSPGDGRACRCRRSYGLFGRCASRADSATP